MAQEKTNGTSILAGILITLGFIGVLGSAGADDYQAEANYLLETTGDPVYDIPPRDKKTANMVNWGSIASMVAGTLLLMKSNKENVR